jgi:hypothetical protein
MAAQTNPTDESDAAILRPNRTDKEATAGATGGNSEPATNTGVSNAQRHSAAPRTTSRVAQKPGPASFKAGQSNKPAKGSTDPIKLYNRYGSLKEMEVDSRSTASPKKGFSHRTP